MASRWNGHSLPTRKLYNDTILATRQMPTPVLEDVSDEDTAMNRHSIDLDPYADQRVKRVDMEGRMSVEDGRLPSCALNSLYVRVLVGIPIERV